MTDFSREFPIDCLPDVFAAAVRPKMVVPAHGAKWDEESHGFGTACRLADGETAKIP
jgi:hypothetical protein